MYSIHATIVTLKCQYSNVYTTPTTTTVVTCDILSRDANSSLVGEVDHILEVIVGYRRDDLVDTELKGACLPRCHGDLKQYFGPVRRQNETVAKQCNIFCVFFACGVYVRCVCHHTHVWCVCINYRFVIWSTLNLNL